MFSTFRYHNEPEGHNLKDKISSLVRIGASIGLITGAQEIAFDPNRDTRTFTRGAGIFMRHMAIPMAVGFTYAVTKYILTNSRKVDDSWNTFLGGAATMPIFYGWLSPTIQQNPRIVVLLPIVLGGAALLAEAGYEFGNMDQPFYRGAGIKGLGQPRVYSTYKLE